MRIALGQLRSALGALESNIERTTSCIAAAGGSGADLLVLPEVCTTGFLFDRAELLRLAEPADATGPALSAWCARARAHDVAVVGGFVERDGDRLFNSAIAIDRRGSVRGLYRKLHLFGRERELFAPGDLGLPVLDIDGVSVGLLICYDLRFLEATRLLVLGGADLVAVPSAWIGGFDADPAPGAEGGIGQLDGVVVQANLNQVFVACADAIGDAPVELGGDVSPHLGRSVLADPFGRIVAGPASSTDEALVVAELDIVDARRVRRRPGGMDPRADRRTDVYRLERVDALDEAEDGAQLLERIQRARGYVLDLHRTLAAWDPAFLASYDAFLHAAYLRSGSLDPRTKELVYVGALVALMTDDAHLEAHMRAALTHGASVRELLEVLEQVLPAAGVPRFLAGMRVFERVAAAP